MSRSILLLGLLYPLLIYAQSPLPEASSRPVTASSQAEAAYPADAGSPAWVQAMYAENPDPGLVLDGFREWRSANPGLKNAHTQYLKRWLREMAREPDGLRYDLHTGPSSSSTGDLRAGGSGWTALGPFDFDIEAEGRSYAPGAAHVYTVEQSTFDPNVLYAGTATAGLWRSDDKGMSWVNLTRAEDVSEIRALEIDHSDPNTIYFGGRGNVWKSTDGGLSWAFTGDAAFQAIYHEVDDLVMSPLSSSVLWLSSNNGFYRSADAGANWTQIMASDIQEIELHPTNPQIVYAVVLNGNATEFWKSTDGGLSFVQKTAGWPAPAGGDEQKRTEIAFNPADPNRVVALATGAAAGGSGLYGIYVSGDAGETWSFSCCGTGPGGVPSPSNPNIMHWDTDGLTAGGQYYYDLALALEPVPGGDILTGGINLWRSSDGGASFINNAHWTIGSAGDRYVHADVHDVRFYGADLWVASDGGIFYSSDGGYHFEKRMNGISGTDFWGFGAGFSDGEVMLGGTYHNATLLKDGDVYLHDWISMYGGDNYRGFVNFGDPRTAYYDGGRLRLPGERTKPLSGLPFAKLPNASYVIGESSDIAFDPRCYRTLYTGNGGGLWRSTNDGAGFELVKDFGPGTVSSVEVARTDPQVLYVAYYPGWWSDKEVWRSRDGGANWTQITPSSAELNGNLWAPFDIAVSAEDADEIWITRTPQSGNYNNLDGHKVFRSDDGGDSWTNWTSPALDGEYPTNILHQRGTDGGVYLGTRRTVFYRNNSMPDWARYDTDLPARTLSVRMVPYYRGGLIRNGSNRGVWEADLFESSMPQAQIAADKLEVSCLRDTVYFADHSVLSDAGASWSWSFPGGTPASSTARHPKVVYGAPGSYSVSLTVSDASGSSSQTLTDLITVADECSPDVVPGLAMTAAASGDLATVPSLDLTTNSLTFSAWVKPDGVQDDYTGIVMHASTGAGLNFRPSMELAYHWPGGAWWWSSGLTVPSGVWSHVALVVQPSSVTVYLNGVGATHAAVTDPVEFGELLIGSYQGWSSRNYRGLIDEVAIWDRALSTAEVRELRHLTKVPADDASLLAYYQFNRSEGTVTDRVGTRHATLGGSAGRITSTAPVGGGESSRLTISGPGLYTFSEANVDIEFGSGATTPDGEVVLSRIDVDPDQWPAAGDPGEAYWILNNYGNNGGFDEPLSLRLGSYGPISSGQSWFPSAYSLSSRGENAEGTVWNEGLAVAEEALPGDPGTLIFGQPNGLTGAAQLAVMRDPSIVSGSNWPGRPLEGVRVWPNPSLWRSAVEWNSARSGEAWLEVSDAAGKLVHQRLLKVETGRNSWDLSTAGWAAGIYTLRIRTQEAAASVNFLVE